MRAKSRGRLGHLRLAPSPVFAGAVGDGHLELERPAGVVDGAGATGQGRDGLRVGVDLVLVADVRAALACYGERYARRLFSEAEIECCRTPIGLSPERLAARFAAKEAAMKVLEPVEGEGPVPAFTAIEVRRRPSGACELVLHGDAAELARQRRISGLALSIVHEGEYAAAVVVGWSAPRSECRSSGNEEAGALHEQAALTARRNRKEHEQWTT